MSYLAILNYFGPVSHKNISLLKYNLSCLGFVTVLNFMAKTEAYFR